MSLRNRQGIHNFDGAPCLLPENAPKFLSVIAHTGAIKVAACKAVCGGCDHAEACLDNSTYMGRALPGVYGGLSEAERIEAAGGDEPETDWVEDLRAAREAVAEDA
jgi:hypothetical protein